MKIRIMGCWVILILVIACKKEPQSKQIKTSIEETVAIEEPTASEPTLDLFLNKDEISPIDPKKIHYSANKGVVLFRPSENDFGLLLEDTQDKSWLTVDDQFEALSTSLAATIDANKELAISVVEKPVIAIARAEDTLYFDAAKRHYGLLLCTADREPVFIAHDTNNIIDLIKSHYTLE